MSRTYHGLRRNFGFRDVLFGEGRWIPFDQMWDSPTGRPAAGTQDALDELFGPGWRDAAKKALGAFGLFAGGGGRQALDELQRLVDQSSQRQQRLHRPPGQTGAFGRKLAEAAGRQARARAAMLGLFAKLHPALRAMSMLAQLGDLLGEKMPEQEPAIAVHEDLVSPNGEWTSITDCDRKITHFLAQLGYPSSGISCVTGQAASVEPIANYNWRTVPANFRGLRFFEHTHNFPGTGSPRYAAAEIWGRPAGGNYKTLPKRVQTQVKPEARVSVKTAAAPAAAPPGRANRPGLKTTVPLPKFRPSERRKGQANRAYAMITGVWDKADEARQAVDCMFNALPASARQGVGRGVLERGEAINRHASSIDMSKMVACLVFNHYSDKVIGRAHGLPWKAFLKARRAGLVHHRGPGWGAGVAL